MSFNVRRAFADVAAAQTDAVLVAAVPGSSIKVLGVAAQAASATTLIFNSKPAGAGVAISATFTGGVVLPETENGDGWFETAIGEALTCTTGVGVATGIQLIFALRV